MNNNNNTKKQHGFYKEANKTILGQEDWTPKKVFSIFKKILKWCLWCFLIVITLWGCVNNFILKTDKNLGQGVEFYQKNDFIYPNMYKATSVVSYTAAKEKVVAGIENDESQTKREQIETNPFKFMITNPNFGINQNDVKEEEGKRTEWEKLQTENPIILSSDLKTFTKDSDKKIINIKDSPSWFSYNLNEMTIGFTNVYDYISKDEGDWDSFVSLGTVPTTTKEAINETLKKDLGYKINKTIDLAYYFADKSDATIDNSVTINSEIRSKFNLKEEEGKEIKDGDKIKREQVTSLKGYLKPKSTNNSFETRGDWIFLNSLNSEFSNKDDKDDFEDIAAWISFLRQVTFLSGDLSGGITKTAIDNGNFNKIKEAYNISAGSKDWDENSYNLSNYIKTDLNTSEYFGSQVIVTSIEKGFPVQASNATKELVDGTIANDNNTAGFKQLRGAAYGDDKYRNDENTKNEGFDTSIQKYGWMLMNENANDDRTHDIMRTYETAQGAFASTTLANEMETGKKFEEQKGNVFYGDTRRIGWGADKNDPDNPDPEKGLTIFDEVIKDMMNKTTYLSLGKNITIDDKVIEYKVASKFAGLTSANEIRKLDNTYVGALPIVKDGKEESILSNSIPPKQDSNGHNRISFVGWSDWGKAFEAQYGPLYGFVIFPLAQISMMIGSWFNYFASAWGTLASIALIVFFTRGLGALLSLKGTKNQMKMQEVQTEVAKIKAKYSKHDLKKDKRMKQKQQQEIMALYRKHEVNPLGSLGTIFITMPIFISLWIIISSLPAYKLVIMGNFSWAISAWTGIFSGGGLLFLYLFVGITVGLIQGISSKLPSWLANKRKGIKRVDEATKAASKKQNRTQNIMVGVFVFMGLTVPALFAFYWIVSGLFTILLELFRHALKQTQSKRIREGKTEFNFENNIKPLFQKNKTSEK